MKINQRKPTMSANLEKINQHRRHLLGAAAMTAVAGFFELPSAKARTDKPTTPLISPASNALFGPLKHIDAGLLNIAYAEAGPADGPPVILLHGWPYDIHSFAEVAPLLAAAGSRGVVPFLGG